MTQSQQNKALAITAIVMTLAAGAFGLLYNRDHNIIKSIKAKNSNIDITGLTESQRKYFDKIKV